MTLKPEKMAFVQEFLQLESEEIIRGLEKLLHGKKTEQHDNEEYFKPMTMEEYKVRIDQAMDDSKNGRMISHEEMLKKIEKWT